MSLVLDASMALAWIFERSDRAESLDAERVLASLSHRPAIVPELFHLEVVNVLATALRRDVLTRAKAADFLQRLDRLPIKTDRELVSSRKEQVFALACERNLTAYDAVYLELALRTSCALATFDRRLAAARDALGVATP